jgi:hypothetical protein
MRSRNAIIFALFIVVALAVVLWQVLGGSKPGGIVGTPSQTITITMAYTSDEADWLNAVTPAFNNQKNKLADGNIAQVQLVPYEDNDALTAIASRTLTPTIWSPASTLWINQLNSKWQAQGNSADLILRSGQYAAAPLVLSPIVFVMWQERADPFIEKYGSVDWNTVQQAVSTAGGWQTICKDVKKAACDPLWGNVKYGQTDPAVSNSGLAAFTLATYNFFSTPGQPKLADLSSDELNQPAYQAWVKGLGEGIYQLGADSRQQMRDMINYGAAQYDVVAIYESLAATQIKNAAGRGGNLKIFYPTLNIYSDHPYGILQAGSSAEQKDAALLFEQYLLSADIQNQGLTYGFRPANPDVAVVNNDPNNPFNKYKDSGLQARIARTSVATVPNGDIIQQLLTVFDTQARHR